MSLCCYLTSFGPRTVSSLVRYSFFSHFPASCWPRFAFFFFLRASSAHQSDLSSRDGLSAVPLLAQLSHSTFPPHQTFERWFCVCVVFSFLAPCLRLAPVAFLPVPRTSLLNPVTVERRRLIYPRLIRNVSPFFLSLALRRDKWLAAHSRPSL